MSPRAIVVSGAYPALVFGGGALTFLLVTADGRYEPLTLLLVAAAALAIVLLERRYPYLEEWNHSQEDVATDLLHNLVNVGSNQLGVLAVAWAASRGVSGLGIWPTAWPFWAQLPLAAVVAELGFYWAHRISHHTSLLWRFHSVHHSSTRLYCLNGERRHPVNHWLEILCGPGLVALLGGGPQVLAVLGTMVVLHLLLQHSNLDYRVGPLRYVFAVAEVHRYHHLKDTRECMVNYGGFLVVWDLVFRTFSGRTDPIAGDGVGIDGLPEFPRGYPGQLAYPFRFAAGGRSSPGDGAKVGPSTSSTVGLPAPGPRRGRK